MKDGTTYVASGWIDLPGRFKVRFIFDEADPRKFITVWDPRPPFDKGDKERCGPDFYPAYVRERNAFMERVGQEAGYNILVVDA